MQRFAQVDAAGVVVFVVEGHAPDDWLPCPAEVSPGYRTEDGGETWAEPVAAAPRRWITKLAFDDRFTEAESTAIEIGQLDDPTAPMASRKKAAALRASQRKVNRATYIDLDRPDTRAGVMALEQAGLLAPGRAIEILDGEIEPDEVFRG